MTTLWNAVTLTAWLLLRKLEAPLCTPLKEKKALAAAVMRRAYHCCNLLEASLCNLATAAGQPQMRALDAQVGLAFMSKVCRQHTCLSCIVLTVRTLTHPHIKSLVTCAGCHVAARPRRDSWILQKIYLNERRAGAVHKRFAVSADYYNSPWPSQGQCDGWHCGA